MDSPPACFAGGGPAWKVQFENQGKWINPLIGWTSTGDALENVGRPLYFSSKEAAVRFAERNGWGYEVEEPQIRSRARPKRFGGYGDNFSVTRKVSQGASNLCAGSVGR
jgi:NADH dehydrogenase (ubiquinone) Fe-S protein 4